MARQKANNRVRRTSPRAAAGPKKTIPVFKSEAEERALWESHDSTNYLDWRRAASARLPNLKPSTQTI